MCRLKRVSQGRTLLPPKWNRMIGELRKPFRGLAADPAHFTSVITELWKATFAKGVDAAFPDLPVPTNPSGNAHAACAEVIPTDVTSFGFGPELVRT